jgi:hypothetical protein
MGKLKRKLKKTKISGGKEIVPWTERLSYFNDYFRPEGFYTKTEIIELNESTIMMRGMVINSNDIIVADGVAHKRANEPFSSQKCQSGALNRALFIFGIADGGEDTIMDEYEAKELVEVQVESSNKLFEDMIKHIEVDHVYVEKKLSWYKNRLSDEQIKLLQKTINAKKSKKAVAKASK